MAFCPNCGAQVNGAFCMRCGNAVGADAPPPPPQPQTPNNPSGWQQQQPPPQQPPPYGQQPPYAQPAPTSAGLDENVASALCYLFTFITGIIFLVLAPYSKNRTVRFHAFQAIFFGVGAIVLNIVMMIVSAILHNILPYGLWFIPTVLSLGVSLCMLAAWIFLMYKAYNRERFKIPILGDLAEKQA